MTNTDSKARKISEITFDPTPTRFSTMIPGLDTCLAEAEGADVGIPVECSVLLVGEPGSGKSTVSTFMAASNNGRNNIIGHGEEAASRVKARWVRLGLKDGDPFVVPIRHAEEFGNHIREISALGQLGFVIVDSVQTLWFDGQNNYKAQEAAVEYLSKLIASLGGVSVFICHVDKSGKSHKGSASLAHIVDVHIHMTHNAKKSARFMEVRKNRMGRAGFMVDVVISSNGITVGTPAPLVDGLVGGTGARNQLERAKETAYAALLEGKALNGYDFDLAQVGGGVWRAGLEAAAKALVRDGHEVLESKINGRKTYQLAASKLIEIPEKPIKIDENGNIVDDVGHLLELD